jgi:hypothetical protein
MKSSQNIIINIILSVALNGCETCLLTLREEQKLKVTMKRVFKRIFVPKEKTNEGDERKVHNGSIIT